MEKNKLRLAVVLFLFVFSLACIFAEDAVDTNENTNKETLYEEVINNENVPSISEEPIVAPEATESVSIKEKNQKVPVTGFFSNLPWEYIITNAIFLLLAAVILIIYLSLRKLSTETSVLKQDINEKIKNIEQKYNVIVDKPQYLSNTDDMRDTTDNLRDTITTLEKNISRLSNEVSILGDLRDLKSKVDTLYSGKRITESIASGKLDVTEAFNLWAANPVGPLPEAFYYIDGEMKIRTKREIKECTEGKWITNRNGTKTYLFPNPNSFNQMTNILELYKMDQAKLKGRGQNRIKIITPCEMTKDGFVEFAGELELL